MRRQILLVSTLAFAMLAPACPPEPQPPQPDSGDAAPPRPPADAGKDAAPQPDDIYGKACAALAAAKCAEGLAANCHDVMKHAEESRLSELHPDCLATKCMSKASCRACSRSIQCP